jgi:hypothetical protein
MGWRGKFEKEPLNSIILEGTPVSATIAGTSAAIHVLIYDKNRHALHATGTDVPTDDTAGYAKGCLFVDTDVAKDTTGLYVNIGTSAECNFDAVADS